MTDGLDLTGTVVTLFGDCDPLDAALRRELSRRGGSTHHVTASTGWLASTINAVLRLDTDSGAKAPAQLAGADQPRSHIVAVCAEKIDPHEAQQIVDLCRSCGDRHDFSLIWHPVLTIQDARAAPRDGTRDPTEVLASTIADEVMIHAGPGRPASYGARTFDPTAPHP